jgi:hypothetical protein
MISVHNISVRKSERQWIVGRPRRRGEDNIRIGLKEIG